MSALMSIHQTPLNLLFFFKNKNNDFLYSAHHAYHMYHKPKLCNVFMSWLSTPYHSHNHILLVRPCHVVQSYINVFITMHNKNKKWYHHPSFLSITRIYLSNDLGPRFLFINITDHITTHTHSLPRQLLTSSHNHSPTIAVDEKINCNLYRYTSFSTP